MFTVATLKKCKVRCNLDLVFAKGFNRQKKITVKFGKIARIYWDQFRN